MNSNVSALRAGFGLIKTTASHWMEDNALRLSAALAYYSIFSIAPLLVLTVGLAGMFLGADAVRGHLAYELKDLIGGQAAQTVEAMVKSTSHPTQSFTATVVGLVTMLIGASGVFGQLKDALNTIWEVRLKPGVGIKAFVMERVLPFGMVLVIGFLLLVSFLLTAILSAFNHWIAAILKLPDWLWGGAGLLLSFAVITLLFALIFKVLPDVKIPWRHVWIGASFTAFFFEIGKFGLAYYLGKESTVSSFGGAGSVVLLLLWVYYASCILLFGAEFTKVYATAHGGRLQPTGTRNASDHRSPPPTGNGSSQTRSGARARIVIGDLSGSSGACREDACVISRNLGRNRSVSVPASRRQHAPGPRMRIHRRTDFPRPEPSRARSGAAIARRLTFASGGAVGSGCTVSQAHLARKLHETLPRALQEMLPRALGR